MVTLQEYKAKKAEETSEVEFRKAQLLERNPRNTEANTSMARYNPITKKPYFVQGVVVNPRYDVKPLDMLSRQLNNEAIEATNTLNPVFRDSSVYKGKVYEGLPRQAEYKTEYWFGKYSPIATISTIESIIPKNLWEMDYSFITDYKNDIDEPLFFDSLKAIPYTAPQDDSNLRLQLTLAQMDANDGKLSQYVVDNTQENIVLLLQKCRDANLPVSAYNIATGLTEVLDAIDMQKPQRKEDKYLSYLTQIIRENYSKPKFDSRLDEICFKPSFEKKIIKTSPFRDKDDKFDESGFRRPKKNIEMYPNIPKYK